MINNTLFRSSVLREARKKFNPEGFDLATALKARKAAEEAEALSASQELASQKQIELSDSELTALSTAPVLELVDGDDVEAVIRAAYKQVFGNAHLMDNERSPQAESKLRSGQITVLEFVRQLAKSDRYRVLFFESCSNLRSIELNFKHLLGRAPESHAEISQHIALLAEGGFNAEIDSYLNSDEYLQRFGTNVVPYYCGYETQSGRRLAAFTHSFQLLKGASSSEKSISTAGNSTAPQLQSALLSDQATVITPLESLPEPVPVVVAPAPEAPPTPEELLEKAFKGVSFTPIGRPEGYYKSSEFLDTPKQLSSWLQESKAFDAASTFPAARKSQPVTLASAGDIEVVIRAAYKQVFGNAHLMESQRLLSAESQLKEGKLSVQNFVRELAKSELYFTLFVEKNTNVRLVELNFKHLLGRAPDNAEEISQHIATLVNEGLEAEIDSYVSSEEYNQKFGGDTVPYYVSYETQTGKTVAGYNRIFQLVKDSCSSDRSIDASQRSQLQNDLLTKAVPKWQQQEIVFNPKGFSLAKALGFEYIPPAIATSYTNAFADSQPIELIPGASAQQLDFVIEAAYKQVFGNAHLMQSERSPEIESQLRSGRITVMEFVRQLAKSQRYRDVFFSPYTNLEAIKLNFKHLLGRAPDSAAEIAHHSAILAEGGFDAEIDSYLNSDEYLKVFGTNIVPYYRGYKTQPGKALAAFTHSFSLLKGASSSDKSIARGIYVQLDQALLSDSVTGISALTGDGQETASQGLTSSYAYQAAPIIPVVASASYQSASSSATPVSDYVPPKQTIGRWATFSPNQYEALESADPIRMVSGRSDQAIEVVISALYKQVLGNAHVMESERLTTAESQLKSGQLSIREFVRALAKSDLYKALFVDNAPRYRSHELNFKHLLGRAPNNYEETLFHSNMLDTQGYEADIDAYLDSDEYQEAFGEDTVPYYRGYTTQTGQRLLGYANMLEILPSVSTSDKAVSRFNTPQLQAQLLPKSSGHDVAAAPNNSNDLIRKALGLI